MEEILNVAESFWGNWIWFGILLLLIVMLIDFLNKRKIKKYEQEQERDD